MAELGTQDVTTASRILEESLQVAESNEKEADTPNEAATCSTHREIPALRLSNLPYNYTQTMVDEELKKLGCKPQSLTILENYGQSQGSVIVVFDTDEDASDAKTKLNNLYIDDRRISTTWLKGYEKFMEKYGQRVKSQEVEVLEEGLSFDILKKLQIRSLSKRIKLTNFARHARPSDVTSTVSALFPEVKCAFSFADEHSLVEAFLEFDSPYNAVQAVAVLDKQVMFGGRIKAIIDTTNVPLWARAKGKLPASVKSLGTGFAPDGSIQKKRKYTEVQS